jgi:hypothetical protein
MISRTFLLLSRRRLVAPGVSTLQRHFRPLSTAAPTPSPSSNPSTKAAPTPPQASQKINHASSGAPLAGDLSKEEELAGKKEKWTWERIRRELTELRTKWTWQKIKEVAIEEWNHFKHGSKVLGTNIRTSYALTKQALNGKQLSRRDRLLLVQTSADLFRMVPFIIILVVPFMEFTLPFLLKIFPNMLPSPYVSKSQKEAQLHKEQKARLEVVKFLQVWCFMRALRSCIRVCN